MLKLISYAFLSEVPEFLLNFQKEQNNGIFAFLLIEFLYHQIFDGRTSSVTFQTCHRAYICFFDSVRHKKNKQQENQNHRQNTEAAWTFPRSGSSFAALTVSSTEFDPCIVKSQPDSCRKLRCESYKPCICIILSSTCFAGCGLWKYCLIDSAVP